MRTTAGIVFVAAVCASGCRSQPSAPAPSASTGADFGGWTWHALQPTGAAEIDICAEWGSWNQKLVYIVLADASVSATTTITAGTPAQYRVELVWPNGPRSEVRVETADGKTGTALCAGRVYDLAQGAVFVVRLQGDALEVRQLRRAVADIPADLPSVQKLIRDDPEIAQLFARAK